MNAPPTAPAGAAPPLALFEVGEEAEAAPS
jgi:hypothetical protein